MCIIGMSFYFNAGKMEASKGAADHSIVWACLSLLTSVLAISAGAGWVFWLIAQISLFLGIALFRVVLDKDG